MIRKCFLLIDWICAPPQGLIWTNQKHISSQCHFTLSFAVANIFPVQGQKNLEWSCKQRQNQQEFAGCTFAQSSRPPLAWTTFSLQLTRKPTGQMYLWSLRLVGTCSSAISCTIVATCSTTISTRLRMVPSVNWGFWPRCAKIPHSLPWMWSTGAQGCRRGASLERLYSCKITNTNLHAWQPFTGIFHSPRENLAEGSQFPFDFYAAEAHQVTCWWHHQTFGALRRWESVNEGSNSSCQPPFLCHFYLPRYCKCSGLFDPN